MNRVNLLTANHNFFRYPQSSSSSRNFSDSCPPNMLHCTPESSVTTSWIHELGTKSTSPWLKITARMKWISWWHWEEAIIWTIRHDVHPTATLAPLAFASCDIDKSWETFQIRIWPIHLAMPGQSVFGGEGMHIDTLPWMGQQPPPTAAKHGNKIISKVQMGLGHDRMWTRKSANGMGSRLEYEYNGGIKRMQLSLWVCKDFRNACQAISCIWGRRFDW